MKKQMKQKGKKSMGYGMEPMMKGPMMEPMKPEKPKMKKKMSMKGGKKK